MRTVPKNQVQCQLLDEYKSLWLKEQKTTTNWCRQMTG